MTPTRASEPGVIDMPMARRETANDPLSFLRRRIEGSHVIDPWGLDPDLVEVVNWLAPLRWNVHVEGVAHLPTDGPAVLVCNRRLGFDEPAALVSGLVRNTERYIRLVGAPDFDPIATVAQRLGALPARAADIASALRAGLVVALPTRREIQRFQLGAVPLELLEPAVALGVPVIPVAVTGSKLGRNWHVRLGMPIEPNQSGGPRAVAELAVHVSAALRSLLEDAATASLWHRVRHNIPGFPRSEQ